VGYPLSLGFNNKSISLRGQLGWVNEVWGMSDIIIFESEAQQVEVRLERETVWLSQKQMEELFDKDVRTVNEHIGNVHDEGQYANG